MIFVKGWRRQLNGLNHKMRTNAFEIAYKIRLVEQFIALKVKNAEMPMPVHLSIGQEFVSAAICVALNCEDYVWGTYRSHGLYIARTGDLIGLFAEILGRASGCSGGRGGSMHLFSSESKLLGTSGIVGSHIPNSVGFAYAQKLLGHAGITCVVFGDGATDAGTFYDSINIAMLRSTPVLFILENNNLAIRTPGVHRQFNQDVASKASRFGINVIESRSSVEEMIQDLKLARDRVALSKTPEMIKLNTVRWYQHLGFEYELDKEYRIDINEAEVINDDPLNIWIKSVNYEYLKSLESDITLEIEEAWKVAKASPFAENTSFLDHTR